MVILVDPPLFNHKTSKTIPDSFGMRNITMAYVDGLADVVESQSDVVVLGSFPSRMPHDRRIRYVDASVQRWQVRNVVFMFMFYLHLGKRISHFNPLVIHSYDYFLLAVCGLLNPRATLFLTTPGNIYERVYNNDCPYDASYIAALKWSLRYLKHIQHRVRILATSPYMEYWYHRSGFKTETIQLLPLPVTNSIPVVEKSAVHSLIDKDIKPVDRQHYHLLFVGDKRPDHNLPALFSLLKRISEPTTKLTLSLVGDGHNADTYRSILGNMISIKYYNHMNHEELRRLYLTADSLVIPRRFNATPRVALEALYAGLPIVANNNESINIFPELESYILNEPFETVPSSKVYTFLASASTKNTKESLKQVANGLFAPHIVGKKLYSLYNKFRALND